MAPQPGTVEAHRNTLPEAAETRRYKRSMRELAKADKRKPNGLLSRLKGIFGFGSRES
jgi:hypothetical protein